MGMLNRRDILVKAPLALASLSVGARWLGRSALAADSSMVTIAYPGDVTSWDPIAAGTLLTISLYKCVFDKPLHLNPDLSFGRSVVESFRWRDEAGMELELKLRDGVTFHNGDPMTSDDIKFTWWDRPQADPTLSIGGSWSGVLVDIATPDSKTAVFKFNAPYVTAPQLLADSSSYVMPRKYFEKVGKDGFMDKPIGSGPYRLVEYQRDSRIVLEAYDKYWDGPAAIKQVTFLIVKDPSARAAAIQSGQVDFANNLPVREVLRLGALPGLEGSLDPISNVIMIHMVNKGIYKDQNLRLAMHHAIDKAALSKAFYGGKAEALSVFTAAGMPSTDPDFKFPYSPDMAKALLAKSGYSRDKPAKVTLHTFNGVFPNDFDVARAIVAMWKQVGIDCALSVIEVAQYAEMARNDKLEAPALYSWFNSTGDPYSYSGVILDPTKRFSVWKSDDIPPKLNPLFREIDYAKRMAGYREFDKWAVEQGYEVPLLQGTGTVVHTKRIAYTPFRSGWVLPYYWKLV
jgi:dipeptide transport system substrate-binding protein